MDEQQIEFLEDMFGNSAGETVVLEGEDAEYIYYEDGFHRPCYLPKSEEGKTWKRCEAA